MTTLPNMGLILPTRGAPGSGHWADTVDADLALMDAHNHQSGRGLPINSAALAIDGDVSFGSTWAITNMQRVTFAAVTALAANNKSLFVSSADSELYWRSNAGANVKLTAGSSLNVAAFVGGIGGDYTAVSAAENYDDANRRYTFKQGGGANWAKLQAGGLRLVEFGTSETVFVEQLCPAALAVTYSMTWPTALPAATSLVSVTSAGQIAFPGPAALPGAATKQLLEIDSAGAISIGPTVPAATGYVTMDSAGALGTKPVSVTYQHSVGLGILGSGDATALLSYNTSTGVPNLAFNGSSTKAALPLAVPVGTITAWAVRLAKTSTSGTFTAKLFESVPGAGTGTPTQIGTTKTNSANNPGDITLSESGLSFAMTVGRQYYIELTPSGVTGDVVHAYNVAISP